MNKDKKNKRNNIYISILVGFLVFILLVSLCSCKAGTDNTGREVPFKPGDLVCLHDRMFVVISNGLFKKGYSNTIEVRGINHIGKSTYYYINPEQVKLCEQEIENN